MVATSKRPPARPSIATRAKARLRSDYKAIKADVKTDLGYFSAALKGEKYDDPNPERTAERAAQSWAAMEASSNSSSDSGSAASPAKPDPKAIAAAKLKAEGRARRKKFVIAKGKKVAKKRKLLLNIKEASA
tara:strand:+ start:979 stop:1374 length:396 start_codon:yes stop_codon:yes gene_type:complete